jgi:glycosyltransferase involved in cell wall biosynthesis
MALMRIAYILLHFPYPTETFVAEEIQAVVEQGNDVRIISILGPGPDPVQPTSQRLIARVWYAPPTVSFRLVKAHLYFIRWAWRPYWRTLYKLCRQPLTRQPILQLGKRVVMFLKAVAAAYHLKDEPIDALHAHFAWLSGGAAWVCSRLLAIPYSVTVHAYDLFVSNELQPLITASADHVIAISEFNQRHLIAQGTAQAHNVTVIHCGVDPSLQQIDRASTRAEGDGPWRIISVGSLVRKKGHAILIEACQLLRQRGVSFTCQIIGQGPEKTHLKGMIARYGLEKQVRLLGSLPHPEIINILRTSDIFVLASVVAPNGDKDGIPVSLMEAGAMGLPLISTRVSGIPELVQHGITGLLVDAHDPIALEEAIADVVSDASLRRELGRNARALIRTEFNIEVNAGRVIEVFRSLVRSREAGARSRVSGIEDALSGDKKEEFPYLPLPPTAGRHGKPRTTKNDPTTLELSPVFPRYEDYQPRVPVWCVTPNSRGSIHRFFDTSPFSPSGRYLGLTRLPFEDRLPSPGDVAEIVVVDLVTGSERVVADTRGWDTQLGAQVQWGASDSQLLFNDLNLATWQPHGVVLDPETCRRRKLQGTVYMATPDGRKAASPCLRRIRRVQPGYGVLVPDEFMPANHGAAPDDGLYLTNTETGDCQMLISHRQIIASARPRIALDEFTGGGWYGFHVKWNPQANHLMMVLRWIPDRSSLKMRSTVITLTSSGERVRVAIPATVWDRGGHHPNWCPDGNSLMMNLRLRPRLKARMYQATPGRARKWMSRAFRITDDGLRIIKVNHDGRGLRMLGVGIQGSGHPSLHPDGQHILTDAYPHDLVAFGDGTVPIRLIGLESGKEDIIIRINAAPSFTGPNNELRLDPHPAWDRAYRCIAFNGWIDGTRKVFVADLTTILGR